LPKRHERRRTIGPEGKPATRQTLLAEPETLAVVDQNLDRCPCAVAEDEQPPAERIGGQALPADAGQAIDAGPKIDRFDRDQETHVRRDLDHAAHQKALHRLARPARPGPLSSTRILAPRGFSSSIVHSQRC
jgi:hypothetical protein